MIKLRLGIKLDWLQDNPIIENRQSSENNYDYLMKLLIVGDTSVGKTSILTRYVDDNFSQFPNVLIGLDFRTKLLDLEGFRIRLQIWDTVGEQRFNTIKRAIYRNAKGVFLVLDLSLKHSLERCALWIDEIQNHISLTSIFVLGNKADLPIKSVFSAKQVEELSNEIKITYYEVSAKTGQNVIEAFEDMLLKITENLVLPVTLPDKEAFKYLLQSKSIFVTKDQKRCILQ